MNNMYDFKDKKITSRIDRTKNDLYIYDDKYIPFSLLFNFTNGSYQSIKELINYYSYYSKTAIVREVEKTLKLWLNDIPFHINLFYTYERRPLISKMYEHLSNSLFFTTTHYRSTTNYIRGYYSLFDRDLTKGYFVLMVKKEYIRYVKLAILLEEPIMEDCFEFWYDESLVVNDMRLRRLTNKVLKELKSIDVPCINKSNIIDLLQPTIDFKAPTIKKQKEMIDEFVGEFQKYENELLNPVKPKLENPF